MLDVIDNARGNDVADVREGSDGLVGYFVDTREPGVENDLFHFDVPGGKWQTVMSMPASAASLESSSRQRRER